MASQTSVQYLTIQTLLASDATRAAIRVTFRNASQAKTAGGNIIIWVSVHDPEYIPDHNETGTNIKPIYSFRVSPHQYSDSKGDSERLASEEKVIFVLKLLRPVLQFIPTDSPERIYEELGQKLLESLP